MMWNSTERIGTMDAATALGLGLRLLPRNDAVMEAKECTTGRSCPFGKERHGTA